jgi:DNA topoisomerase VI subunit A
LQPTIIPAGDDIEGMVVEEDIGWILVVEKEVMNQCLMGSY